MQSARLFASAIPRMPVTGLLSRFLQRRQFHHLRFPGGGDVCVCVCGGG